MNDLREFAFHMKNESTGEKRIKKIKAACIEEAHCRDVRYGTKWTWIGTGPWTNVVNRVKHIGNGYYKYKEDL